MFHQVEYRVETLSLFDPEFQNKIADLTQEGWDIMPGVMPVVIYHLQRRPGFKMASPSPVGGIAIKEEGVTILRAAPPAPEPTGTPQT